VGAGTISGSSVTVNLKNVRLIGDYNFEMLETPWTGNGPHMIELYFLGDRSGYIHSNGQHTNSQVSPQPYNISSANSVIALDKFSGPHMPPWTP